MMIIPLSILAIENESDRSFMESLYVEQHRRMLSIAKKYVQNAQDAEDIVGDAVVALIDKVELLKTFNDKTVQVYASVTVKRFALSFLRKQKHVGDAGVDVSELPLPDDEALPEEEILRRSSVEDLRKALRRLTEDEQMLIQKKYLLDMTSEEIARTETIEASTVRTRLFRTRQKVCRMLKEMEENG